ncbi:MAG: TIGR03084 family metal-binding protein [Ilumatobacteraceae bacterium]
MDQICDDLAAELESLDAMVADLDEPGWDTPTASPGWSVRDQISHLWFFDQRAVMAMTDADAFAADTRELMAAGGTEASVLPGRSITGAEMLQRWRADRARLLEAGRAIDASARVPWYGPAMGARSFITARLMEAWAHGQDVADALGIEREATERLRHVGHIGVRARPFSYAVRDMPMPDADIHVALTTPSGDTVAWGAPGSADRVSGPLLDFCLVVTQRRHVADTALDVHGPAAIEWISIAQAFAGAPGPGRQPGQFVR